VNPREARTTLINRLVRDGYLRSKTVVDAMLAVPREVFVPEAEAALAYDDHPLPIGFGQTISAPHMVAIMTELLDAKEDSRILEIGSGSGYQAAVLSRIASKGFVYTVERIPELARIAEDNLGRFGAGNVKVIVADGTVGYQAEAPYDRIIVTAASPRIPSGLVGQLAEGGLMLVPVGGRWYQDLMMVRRKRGEAVVEGHGGCVFVPLVGKDGWPN